MKSSTVCFALSVALLASSNGFCDCDDDDNCVGLFLVDGSFEITQNDVFSGETDAVRVWGPLADLTVSGGSIVGESGTGAREFGSDGIDVDLGGRVIVNGGMISGSDDGIKVKTDSTVTINAGTIFGGGSGLRTTNSSRVTINGGDISGNEFGSRHTRGSDTLIFGGNIDGTTRLEDDSSLSIFGGEMDSISAGGSAIIKIFGGMPTVPISLYERSRVAIFRDSAGNLLDGSTLESSIDQLSFDSRVSNFETTSTDTVILNSVEAFAVLNGDNDTATTVDMRADAFTNEAYVAEDSTLILRSGMANLVTVDDSGLFAVGGGRSIEVFARGNSSVRMSNGRIDRLRLAGASTTTLVGGNSFMVDAFSTASLLVEGGSISNAASQGTSGVNATDEATISISDGSVSGSAFGVTAGGSAQVFVSGGRVFGRDAVGLSLGEEAFADVSGGVINGVSVKDSASIQVSGGMIEDDLLLSDSAAATISGGEILDDVRTTNGVSIKMTGGTVHGDFDIRDQTVAEISGGQIGRRIEAQEDSLIRVFGTNMSFDSQFLTGRLLDGTRISTPAEALDNAEIIVYDTFTSPTTISRAMPGNVAVRGNGPTTHVDFDADASVAGELLITEDGRANIFGGSIAGKIGIERNGVAAFYGTGLVPNRDGTVSGTLMDGTEIDVVVGCNTELESEFCNSRNGTQTLLYEAIRTDTVLDFVDTPIAVFDGVDGPTVVDIDVTDVRSNLGTIDVREESRVNILAGGFFDSAMAVWDRATLSVKGGGHYQFHDDAIFAHDSSHVEIEGGSIKGERDGLRAWDSSSVTMSGGLLEATEGDALDLKHNAVAVIVGGDLIGDDEGIKAKGFSSAQILGGNVRGYDNGVAFSDDTRLVINGDTAHVEGTNYGIKTSDRSIVEIRSGTVSGVEGSILATDSSVVDVFGGDIRGALFASGGVVNVFGNDLVLNGTSLSGFLTDGSEINLQAFVEDGGSFVLYNDGNRPCDFDGNKTCDIADIDALLYEGLASGDAKFDLDRSGTVDLADRDEWLRQAQALEGDFDGDGNVGASDLNILGSNWNMTVSSYAEGDSNGDGIANAADLNYLGSNWTSNAADAAAVPEPNGLGMFVMGLLLLEARRHCRRT